MSDLSGLAGGVANVRVAAKQTQDALGQMDNAMRKAARQATRRAGRKMKQVMRRNAPVGDRQTDPHPGLLKKSIHQNKRLKRLGDATYHTAVGPGGGWVNAYRHDAEARHGYVARSYDEAFPIAMEAYNAEFRKVLTRAGYLSPESDS